MKAERRHELKESSLTHSVKDVGAFIRNNSGRIIWGLVFVVLIAFIIGYSVQKRRNAMKELWTSYAALTVPGVSRTEEWANDMRDLVNQDRDELLAALANVSMGDYYLNQSGAGDAQALDKAAESYNTVLSRYSDHAAPVAMAHFGLAKAAESRGDLSAAGAEYDKVISDPAVEGYPISKIAATEKENLPRYAESVTMIAERASAPATTQPASDATSRPFDPSDRPGEEKTLEMLPDELLE